MKQHFCLILLFFMVCVIRVQARTSISITTHHTQIVLQVLDNNRLYQTYFGNRLSDATDLEQLPVTGFALTSNSIKGWEAYPVMGTEDYWEPALELTHADGNPTSVLKYVSHKQTAETGGMQTDIVLKDPLYPVTVTLHYRTFVDEDVIKQWTDIRSDERGGVYLSRYASSMLYLQAGKYYLTEFGSDWAKEMQQIQTPLVFGKKIVDSRLGTRANMVSMPFFEVGLDAPVSEDQGTVLMGTLAWTGNFRYVFEVDNDNELRVVAGVNPDAARYKLDRGQVFTTPELVFTLSDQGVGEGSRRLQRFVLNHQLYKGKEDRLTLLNNWEDTYFDFNEEKLTHLFGEAKQLGVDMFLLDDGWFGNKYPRKDDHAGLGDWQVTKSKLPNGLPHLVKAANEQGVEFGLWIEPEMVNPKSELAEKHPDWILTLPNRDPYYFRNQLVLDLTNPKVQDFVFSVVDGLMKENPKLKFLKWDCNSPITNIYSPYEKNQGNLYVDYVRGFYSVLDRIQKKYPDLMMMMCSGGGGRSDYAGLKYFTEFWCSDNTDPIQRLYIQWGYSQFMPSKTMCSHVTNWNSRASVKFRVDVAFPYKLGFDIDLKKLSQDEMSYCVNAIKEYNRLKPVIYSPDLYRLVSPYESNHCVMQRVSQDKGHSLVYAYDLHPLYGENLLPTRLKGLDPDAHYLVREVCLMPGSQSWLSCDGKTFTGDFLMKVGIKVLSSNDMVSHIIEIVKQ